MRILIAFLIAVSIASCSTQKALIGDDFKVSMEKGSCFGTCPVYSLSIDKVGYAIFDGERFTDKIGEHGMQLPKSKLEEVATAFSEADFMSFDNNYPSSMSDLPLVHLVYQNNTLVKRVSGKDDRPQKLRDLQSILEGIAQSDGWVSLDTTTVTEEVVEEPKEDLNIYNEIIIKFKPGTFISKWLKQFKPYSLYVKKPLDDDRMTWVTNFDMKKIEPEELLEMVKSDPVVLEAEFNKKTSKR